MPRLSPHELRDRLAFDYKVARELTSPALDYVRAFKSAPEMAAGREASREEGEAGLATHFIARFSFPFLVGPGKHAQGLTVAFDLLVGKNYPFTPPFAQVVSRPIPWSPHFQSGTGIVCLGEGWSRARGRMLFGELVVHVMRLANCDEPDSDPSYVGWNREAIAYWRTVLGRQPVNPDLVYPSLPTQITHGVADTATSFAPASEGIRAAGSCAFAPVRERLLEESGDGSAAIARFA